MRWLLALAVVCVATQVPAAIGGTPPNDEIVMFRAMTGKGNTASYDIVVAEADGSGLRVLSGSSRPRSVRPALFDRPRWSPDGRQVVFTGDIGKGPDFPTNETDLFVMNADGSGLHRLTYSRRALYPVWSPDGRSIVFARRGAGRGFPAFLMSSLWAVAPDGSALRQLTASARQRLDLPSAWSPDGRLVAFTRVRIKDDLTSLSAVWTLRLPGQSVRLLAAQAATPPGLPMGAGLPSSQIETETASSPTATRPSRRTSST